MLCMLADTVLTAPQILEVLNNVHEFYDQAWNKLIWAVAAVGLTVGFVVGVLVPWWMERRRKESFDAVQKELGEAKDRMAAVEEEIDKANEEREARSAETMEQVQHARDDAIGRLEKSQRATEESVALLEGRVRASLGMALQKTTGGRVNDVFIAKMYCDAAGFFIIADAKAPAHGALSSMARIASRPGAAQALRGAQTTMKDLRRVLEKALEREFVDADENAVKVLQNLLDDAPPGQAADSNEDEGEKTDQDGAGATQTPPADS